MGNTELEHDANSIEGRKIIDREFNRHFYKREEVVRKSIEQQINRNLIIIAFLILATIAIAIEVAKYRLQNGK